LEKIPKRFVGGGKKKRTFPLHKTKRGTWVRFDFFAAAGGSREEGESPFLDQKGE